MVDGKGAPLRRRALPALALVSVLLVAASGAPAASTSPAAGPAGGSGGRWALTFADEFEGTSLDPRWESGFGWGPASGNTFGYCDPDNSVVGGGVLVQRIEARPQHGKPWSVGCLNTRNRFAQLHGYFEARIWAPGCDGARSAFWGKPDDESWPPELDVVEIHGDEPHLARLTQHWRGRDGVERRRRLAPGPDFSAGYHVFGAEWSPSGTVWYVDGVEQFRTGAGASAMGERGPFYLILNAQVYLESSTCGTDGAGTHQYVDWVRVWARDGERTSPAPQPWIRRRASCRPPAPTPGTLPEMPSGTGEVSGMATSARYPDVAWLIRDSGRPASLYAFRRTPDGPRIREIPVRGAANRDWEEVVYAPGPEPDGPGRIWVVESGQTGRHRWLYEIVEPDPDRAASARVVGRYRYAIPDRRRANVEAAFLFGDHLALVVKASPSRVYRFRRPLSRSGVNRPSYVGSLRDADNVSMVRISPDRRLLVAASHKTFYTYDAGAPVRSPAGFLGRRPTQIQALPAHAAVEAGDWFPAERCRMMLLSENRSRFGVRLNGTG